MNVSRPDVVTSALAGMQQAQARMADDADRISKDPSDVEAIADVQTQPYAYAADATVLRSYDNAQLSLLNMLG